MTELRWETDADGNLAFKGDDGNTILRLNQDGSIDEVKSLTTEDASVANTPTDATDVARKTEIDAKADDPHTLGGLSHDADTLANLNDKISDAVLDDSGDARAPTSHAPTHVTGGTDALGLNDFALPEGAYVDEEGGDLVIRDSSNAIVLRRDEAASEWVMDSVSTEEARIGRWQTPTLWVIYNAGSTIKAQQRIDGLNRKTGTVPYSGDATTPSEVHSVIQQALNDIPALSQDYDGQSKGGRIHFMGGEYVIGKDTDYFESGTGLMRINTPGAYPNDSFVQITGSGWGTRIKRADGVNEDLVYIENPGVETYSGMGPQIKDIRLYGNKQNNTSGSGVVSGSETGTMRETIIDHCVILGFNGDGVNLQRFQRDFVGNMTVIENNDGSGVIDVEVIRGAEIHHNTNGVRNAEKVGFSEVHNNSQDGILLDNNGYVVGCHARDNGQHGVSLGLAANAQVWATRSENNGGVGFYLSRGEEHAVQGYAAGNTNGPYTIDGSGELPCLQINGALAKLNLSGETGAFDGQRAQDDGTNTANNGLMCYWDNQAGAWQPSSGSTTFT